MKQLYIALTYKLNHKLNHKAITSDFIKATQDFKHDLKSTRTFYVDYKRNSLVTL